MASRRPAFRIVFGLLLAVLSYPFLLVVLVGLIGLAIVKFCDPKGASHDDHG